MNALQTTSASTAVVLADRPRLTWEEICRRFKNRWVLMVDLDWAEWNPTFILRSATVLSYSRKRHDALFACEPIDAGYHDFALWFTGPLTGPLPPDDPGAP